MTNQEIVIKRVVLFAESLLSKWGFEDGDVLADDTGVRHELLVQVIKDHLLPLLHGVEVFEICTCHNPVRATEATKHLILERFADVSVSVEVGFQEETK